MSANDAIVLKANFQSWKSRAEGLQDIDPWLYYCIEQFVKLYALDDEEIQYGITDGGNDGGVDAFYFLVNQRNPVSEYTEMDAKNVSKIRLLFFQIKTSGGFKPTEIEKWIELTDDFFDLSKSSDGFGVRYNDRVVRAMQTWRDKYIKWSGSFPEIMVDFYYITGEDILPDDYAKDSAVRVIDKIKQHLEAACNVHFIGAEELWKQVQRRPPKERILKWSDTPMEAVEGYVGLVGIGDYCEFLEDEPGVLAERIFESNVRGFQQDRGVNSQILGSLENPNKDINFWLLNNGVTIITPKYAPAGHRQLNIEDPQIVNGLQTSRVIFEYFTKHPDTDDGRSVIVRVIQTDDLNLQDSIIRATNSQNRMSNASLRMTDQVHRNIEELFKKFDLIYDRRKGFYRDQGKPIRKIISVNEVVQAAVSVLLQRPDDARARPGNYFRDDKQYQSVFDNEKIPLLAYLQCVQLVRRVEQFLRDLGVQRGEQRNLKFYVAAMLAREITQLAKPISQKLPDYEKIPKIDDNLVLGCYDRTKEIYDHLAITSDRDTIARGTEFLKGLHIQWSERKAKNKAKKTGKPKKANV